MKRYNDLDEIKETLLDIKQLTHIGSSIVHEMIEKRVDHALECINRIKALEKQP